MRTDRTWLCPVCAERREPAAACPRCGGALVDLAHDAEARRIARAIVAARRSRPSSTERRRQAATIVGAGLFFFGGVTVAPLVALVGFAILFATGLEGRIRDIAGPADDVGRLGERGIAIGKSRVSRRERAIRTRAHGRVRTLDAVTAPLSGRPCAAFRLVGATPHGPIDDGGGGRFVLDDAGATLVDGQRASVALPAGSIACIDRARLDGPLGDYLSARGALLEHGAVWLAETLLVDGDQAIVEGLAVEELAPSGYRGAARVRVFREREGAPLTIFRRD